MESEVTISSHCFLILTQSPCCLLIFARQEVASHADNYFAGRASSGVIVEQEVQGAGAWKNAAKQNEKAAADRTETDAGTATAVAQNFLDMASVRQHCTSFRASSCAFCISSCA